MHSKINLPFGETSVTSHKVRKSINYEKSLALLHENIKGSGEDNLDRLLQDFPDLLKWLEDNGRDYPWRWTTEPWEVYVAEILLQRTRADAVADVFPQFVERYPDAGSLYRAENDEIRDMVECLGFVNHRIKCLDSVSEHVVENHDGEVPDSVEELKKPWRIGNYCARASLLFSRGVSLALVDTNIARIIERVLKYNMPEQPHKSKELYTFMDALTPADSNLARAFNLAMIDLGALVCRSGNPTCEKCPLRGSCNYYHD